MQVGAADIGAYLADRTRRDGDCLVWIKACGGDAKTTPIAKINGSVRTVRRELARILFGDAAMDDRKTISVCGKELCVAPGHIRLATFTEVSRHHAAHGRTADYSSPARAEKIAATKRRRAGLDAYPGSSVFAWARNEATTTTKTTKGRR